MFPPHPSSRFHFSRWFDSIILCKNPLLAVYLTLAGICVLDANNTILDQKKKASRSERVYPIRKEFLYIDPTNGYL